MGQSTPVFLPGEFHGQRSLVGYSPWGHTETDVTEVTWHTHTHTHTHTEVFSPLAFGSALRESCQAETSGVQPGSYFGNRAVAVSR